MAGPLKLVLKLDIYEVQAHICEEELSNKFVTTNTWPVVSVLYQKHWSENLFLCFQNKLQVRLVCNQHLLS